VASTRELFASFMSVVALFLTIVPSAAAEDRAFRGFYAGAELGSQSIIGGSLVDGVDVLSQDDRALLSLLCGFRHPLAGRFVVGVEGSVGMLNGDLSLSDPANGLAIDYQNTTQVAYGLVGGLALGTEKSWLLFGYLSETTRNFDVTVRQQGNVFHQTDEQGMLRYGAGVEKQIRQRVDLRVTAGTGRADFGDQQTNIEVEKKLEYAAGVLFRF
jgi:Outer membrane protein beta-barrel domain